MGDLPSNAPRFSEVVHECLEHQRQEGIAAKTIADKRSVAEMMIRIVGDLPVDLITRQDARKYRETALKLPPRIYQLPEGQSLEQIIKNASTTISLTTFIHCYTPRVIAGSQPRLGAITSQPAMSGSSSPVTAGRLVGAARGAVRLKLKVAVGTRRSPRWAVAFPWFDQSSGGLPALMIERHG